MSRFPAQTGRQVSKLFSACPLISIRFYSILPSLPATQATQESKPAAPAAGDARPMGQALQVSLLVAPKLRDQLQMHLKMI